MSAVGLILLGVWIGFIGGAVAMYLDERRLQARREVHNTERKP